MKDNGAYFLCFLDEHYSKNSYASSLGVYSLAEEQKVLYKDYLKSFRYISCRENVNAAVLSSLLKRRVEHVLDPTLLLDADDWRSIEIKCNLPDKYVLCYCLGEKKSVREFARKLGLRHNLPVFYIPSNYRDLYYKNVLFNIGPLEFIYLFRHATYICTDSFHGTAFSINFEKNFYSFYKRKGDETCGDNSRILHLLKEFSLLNRLKFDEFEEEEDINYKDSVEQYLKSKRNTSYSFLNQILFND